MNTIYVRHNSTICPDMFASYWDCRELVPENLDFYPETTISSVSIKVFKNQFLQTARADDNKITFEIQASYVNLKCVDQDGEFRVKVGLHLFPIMRFKKEFLPVEMDFYIKDENKQKIPVELPTKMAKNLLNYLNNGKPNLGFTCVQFAEFLNGVYTEKPEHDDWLSKYVLAPIDQNLLETGNVIIFNDEKNEPVHVAIYLRDELYLWHSGGACLRVSTYENIIRCYSAKSADIAHLKG